MKNDTEKKMKTLLSGHELFLNLERSDIDLISDHSGVKRVEAEDTIYRYGAAVTHVFLCLEGAIQLEVPANKQGVATPVSRVAPGELFGVCSLTGASRYPTTARALEPTTFLTLESKLLRRVLQSSPLCGYQVMSNVALIYFNRYITTMQKLHGALEQII